MTTSRGAAHRFAPLSTRSPTGSSGCSTDLCSAPVVVDELDAVAVGVEQERAVVVRLVVGPLARRPGITEPGGRPGAPERIDVGATRRDETDMQSNRYRASRRCVQEREIIPLDELVVRVRRFDPELAENRAIERLRGKTVADADRDVVEHRQILRPRSR